MNNSAKQDLKIAFENKFPGVKFTITTRRLTAKIHYTDGPAQYKVQAFANSFEEKGFDAMRDIMSYHTGVKSGFDYVYAVREISPKFADSLDEYVSHFREEDRPAIRRQYWSVEMYFHSRDLDIA